jgi:DNA-binding NtrC family response regulator
MPHRLVIIGERSTESGPGLGRLLPAEAGFAQHCLDWDRDRGASLPESVRRAGAQLVIVLAGDDRERALSMLRGVRGWSGPAPVLAVLPAGADDDVFEAASQAADDFICSPVRKDELQKRVLRLIGPGSLDCAVIGEQLERELSFSQLVGRDPVFVRAVRQIPLLAASDAPVLLLGETGTGKELCARAIHHLSPRRRLPFIPVDCGALPEHLAENELFGHTRGAFTGAHAEQKGLAGMAEGGTLFLDEIDALSLAVQAKLLRFLEERTYRSLGADRFTQANVRVLAATNRDLEALVRERQFRSDLYFRLNVLELRLPPLRERRVDIPLLARHFLDSLPRASAADGRSFSAAALRALQQYAWPGNVRELFNAVRRAAVLSGGGQILPAHISIPGLTVGCAGDLAAEGAPGPNGVTFCDGRAQAIALFEKCYAEDLLRKHQGNITRAAIEARKDRRAFGRLVKKYGLNAKALRSG